MSTIDVEKTKNYKLTAEKLYKMYIIKNKENYNGGIEKYECVINNERGIFKERVSTRSKDHIMEQIAYELAIILGVSCCKASCRKAKGLYGSFSRFEVTDLDNVIPYEDIIGYSELSSDDLLKITMQLTRNNINSFIIQLYQYIIFDYILGQQDRHLENLSIYKKSNNQKIWYPLYDNGFCCFSVYDNDTAIQCLNNRFYSSRIGQSEDILNTLYKYRQLIFKDDLRKIIRYDKLNKELILKIIDKADKYNQMTEKRRDATADFILKQAKDIHTLNVGKVGN